MSNKIDNRVVHMQFDNAKFIKGANDTLKALINLDDSISSLSGKTLSNIDSNIESMSSKMSVFGAIGFSAINKLTTAAMDFGGSMISNVMNPITEGGKKRSLNIEQARFQFKGLGMDAEKYMGIANDAVSGTAFGLDEAARVTSILGASMDHSAENTEANMAKMSKALRGISGVAAMSGSSFSDVGDIFSKISGQGRLMGDDLLRLSSRSINAAATLGKHFGKSEAEIRQMVSEGKISFEMFSEAMDEAFGDHAAKANETYAGSLSNVRSALGRIGQPFYDVKHENHRKMFNALIPVINSFKEAFSPVVDLYSDFMGARTNVVVKVLESLVEPVKNLKSFFQALTDIVRAIVGVFKSLLAPIGAAFKQVFNLSGAGSGLYNVLITVLDGIAKFINGLKLGGTASKALQAIFTGLFGAIKLVGGGFVYIIKGIGSFIGWIINLVKSIDLSTNAFDGIKEAFGKLLDTFNGLDTFTFEGFKSSIQNIGASVKEVMSEAAKFVSDGMTKLFGSDTTNAIRNGFTTYVATPIKTAFSAVGEFFSSAFSNIDLSSVSNAFKSVFENIKNFFSNIDISGPFDGLKSATTSVTDFAKDGRNAIGDVWDKLEGFVFWVKDTFGPMFEDAISIIKNLLAEGKEWIDWDKVLGAANLGTILVIITAVKNIFESFKDITGNITETFTELKDGIVGLQQESKPTMLIKIAVAIGLLAGAVWLLGQLDGGDLMASLGAVTFIIGLLTAALWGIAKILEGKEMKGMAKSIAALILLSVAVSILASAMNKLADLSWEDLAQGMLGIAGSMGILLLALWALSELDTDGMMKSAAAMVVLSAALFIMSTVITKLGEMDPLTMVQGLIGIAVALGLMVGALGILSETEGSTLAAATALLVMAGALFVMWGVVWLYAQMSWETLIQGVGAMAVVLVLLVGALWILAQKAGSVSLTAGALFGLAVAIGVMALAVWFLGNLELSTLIQGLAGLAGILFILATATSKMTKAIPGAAALLLVSAAIVVLSWAITKFGDADPWTIAKGLGILAGALLIIGIAAGFLTAGSVGLSAFAGAVLALGFAALLVAASVRVFAWGLDALGPAMSKAGEGLRDLGGAAKDNVGAILPLAGLALSLLLFGAALLAIGVGGAVAGLGLMLLGVGMGLIIPVADDAGQKLKDFINILSNLELARTGPLALGLGALGAATLVLGAGMAATGFGMKQVADKLPLFKTLFDDMEKSFGRLKDTLTQTVEDTAKLVVIAQNFEAFIAVSDRASTTLDGLVKTIKGLNNAFGSTGGAFTTFSTSLQLVSTTAQATVGIIVMSLTKLVTQIASIGKKLITVFKTLTDNTIKSITRLEKDSTRTIKTLERSLSTNLRRITTDTMKNLTSFIRVFVTATPQLVRTATAMTTALSSSLVRGLNNSKLVSGNSALGIGLAITNGLVRGINRGIPSVTAAARRVAARALNSAKAELAIASPSKKGAWLGEMFDEGIAKGMLENANVVENSSSKMAEAILKEMEEVVEQIAETIEDDPEFTPTITPVLDMSNVNGISDIFGNDPTIRGSANLARTASSTYERNRLAQMEASEAHGNNPNITMIQNNTSPKALSRAEIYRQTKNQISTLKGKLGSK